MATKKIKKAKKPVKKAVKKTKKPVKKSAKKIVKKPAKKPAKKIAKKPAKKAVKKIVKKAKKPAKPSAKKTVSKKKVLPLPGKTRKEGGGKMIGKILHYFDKISVAVVELDGELFVGDAIRIIGGEETDFKQVVDSMELEHEKIGKAKKGQAIGVELKGKAREGYKVYKI